MTLGILPSIGKLNITNEKKSKQINIKLSFIFFLSSIITTSELINTKGNNDILMEIAKEEIKD